MTSLSPEIGLENETIMIKKFLLSAFALCISTLSIAQITGITVEVEQVYYDVIGGYDFNGYVTYRVYVDVTNEDDQLSAIYGLLDDVDPLNPEDLYVTGSCGCYDSENAGNLGTQLNASLCEIPGFEDTCLDTFWTVGNDDSSDPGVVFEAHTVVIDQSDGTVSTVINDICTDLVDDGVVFSTNDQPNVVAGPDLRILAAQFTVCGEMCFDLSAQVFYDGGQFSNFNMEPTCIQFPCDEFPIDETFTVLEDIECFGNTATVEFGGGGNESLEYQLWSVDAMGNPDEQLLIQNDDPVFAGLTEGDYLVSMIDGYGCRDTSQVFSFVEPTEMVPSMEFTQNNECFGADQAEICVDVVGGTLPYSIELLDCDDNVINTINNNECFSDISCVNNCGDFSVRVRDANQCEVIEEFSIACPSEITFEPTLTEIQCAGVCEAGIEGQINGGTGLLTLSFDPPLDVPAPSAAPIDVNIQDICTGIYTLTITDENGCVFEEVYDLTEPDGMTITYDIEDAVCFGDCNGTITANVLGGVPNYTFEITDLDGVPAPNPNALCAGEYIHTTFDGNNCFVIDTLEILEPEQIVFETEVSNILCAGETNGEICITNITGGIGEITFGITPVGSGILDENCFTNLAAQNYSVSVSDDLCTVSQNGVAVLEPEALELTLSAENITCFGDNDGTVDVSVTGGTGAISMIEPFAAVVPTTIENRPPGFVTVTVEDESGCSVTESIEILEPELLTATVLSTSNVGCGGECDGDAELDISGGTGDYFISFDGIELNLNQLCAQDYNGTLISDDNGCETSVDFEIIQPEPLEILNTVTPVTCTGMNDGSIDIFPVGGTGPLTWESVPEGLDLENLFEGEYEFVVFDSTGCSTDTVLTLGATILTDMTATMFSSPVTCWNENDGTATAAVSGGTEPITYQWNDEQGQITATAVGLAEETYIVTIVDAIGCTITETIEVEPTEGCFFIATALTPNGDGANDTWTIGGLEFFPQSSVQVFNRWGQLLFESTGYNTPWDGRYNGSELPVADYYFIITYDQEKEPITGTVTIKY